MFVPNKSNLVFLMAPDCDVFHALVQKLRELVSITGDQPSARKQRAIVLTRNSRKLRLDDPHNATDLDVTAPNPLFVIKAFVHSIIPYVVMFDDEGIPHVSLGKAIATVIMSILWLAVASYSVVVLLEALAGTSVQSSTDNYLFQGDSVLTLKN